MKRVILICTFSCPLSVTYTDHKSQSQSASGVDTQYLYISSD